MAATVTTATCHRSPKCYNSGVDLQGTGFDQKFDFVPRPFAQQGSLRSRSPQFFGEAGELFFHKRTPGATVHSLGKVGWKGKAPSTANHFVILLKRCPEMDWILRMASAVVPNGYQAVLIVTTKPPGDHMPLKERRPIHDWPALGESSQPPGPGDCLFQMEAKKRSRLCWQALNLDRPSFVGLNILLVPQMSLQPLLSGQKAKLDAQSYQDAWYHVSAVARKSADPQTGRLVRLSFNSF